MDSSRIFDELQKINDRLSEIDKTLVKNTENLAEHMRRTNALEEKVEPVQKHVLRVEGALKLFGILLTVAGVVAAILKVVL